MAHNTNTQALPLSFSLYRSITWLAAPLLPFLLKKRITNGKEIQSRLGERYGTTQIARPQGKLIWFHAASMGELNSILPLIAQIKHRYPERAILVSTVTVTSAHLAASRLPNGVIHQFAPLDTPQAIHAFLRHWQPSFAYFVDSEFWPNMLLMTKASGCRLLLLNARISERSFHRWLRYPTIITTMLNCFETIYAKSTLDAERLRGLGARHVLEKGNLKFSTPALPYEHEALTALQAQIGTRPVWLAASTHEGEEAMALEVHHQLSKTYPDLLTIIIPRHNVRGGAIEQLCKNAALITARRSLNEIITTNTHCYIADTMGEMGLFYRLSSIVFVGGSLVAHGGQNPFEPARLDCAICYGQHMHNFKEFCEELARHDAAHTVHNAQELAHFVQQCIQEPHFQRTLANNAHAAVAACQGALETIAQDILLLLEEQP
jgi:3-deoxy-D-manno-octulosonic-acid transferase